MFVKGLFIGAQAQPTDGEVFKRNAGWDGSSP